FFLEIITTDQNRADLVDAFHATARSDWQKDPYVMRNGGGIRTRMLCAMIREAFYLVENEYVSVESIDRGCRNDAGYYMPFAGNFRYMDLMGTYIYGLVMQDLNPELSKNQHVPSFFQEIIRQGGSGMASGKGFYAYRDGEAEDWEAVFERFSYQISQLISKYPFNYTETPELTSDQFRGHE
ncbi:MAG: 3-hydroxyacyl-CoA dehydrogenase, partial [Ferruginibacter sp.]|nr:3-hydroxyacyl-CoA dehydrogenase [Cytophagales bacterium]